MQMIWQDSKLVTAAIAISSSLGRPVQLSYCNARKGTNMFEFESFKMELFERNTPSPGCVQQGKLTSANLFTPVTAQCCASSHAVGSRVNNPGPSVKHRFQWSGELIKRIEGNLQRGKTPMLLVQPRTCYICHEQKSSCPKFNWLKFKVWGNPQT